MYVHHRKQDKETKNKEVTAIPIIVTDNSLVQGGRANETFIMIKLNTTADSDMPPEVENSIISTLITLYDIAKSSYPCEDVTVISAIFNIFQLRALRVRYLLAKNGDGPNHD
jgi:hypothetical protein